MKPIDKEKSLKTFIQINVDDWCFDILFDSIEENTNYCPWDGCNETKIFKFKESGSSFNLKLRD